MVSNDTSLLPEVIESTYHAPAMLEETVFVGEHCDKEPNEDAELDKKEKPDEHSVVRCGHLPFAVDSI